MRAFLVRIARGTAAAMLGFFAAADASGGTLYAQNTITAPDGRTRYFNYFVPDNMPANPAVLFLLHGGNADYNDILQRWSVWKDVSDANGFLLIIPNGVDADDGKASGTDQNWNDCRGDAGSVETGADDVGFLGTLIDWAVASFGIDAQRVYATGASNGGMMSYRLARELSDRIAAVAAFIANEPAVSQCTWPANPIPVFICNGTADQLMPWNGGARGRAEPRFRRLRRATSGSTRTTPRPRRRRPSTIPTPI